MVSTSFPETDMAVMAMKGQRYEEAVSLYQSLLMKDPSPGNWMGLGYAKIGLVYSEKASPDEVMHCFKKAVEISPAQRKQIEIYCVAAVGKIMQNLAVYCESCYEQSKHQKRRMLYGGITTGLGASIGLSKRNTLFTNVMGIAGVAGGAATMYSANSKLNEIRLGYEKAINIYNNLFVACENFLQNSSGQLVQLQQTHQTLMGTYKSISGKVRSRGILILTFGILGLFPAGPFLAIPAWVMGYADLKKMETEKMDRDGQGLTKAGMFLGIAGCLIWGFFIFGKSLKN